jgi:hypothetical protein
MLAAGFGPATGAHVAAADVAAFMVGMSLLLTVAGAALAIAVICAGADRAAVWRALRPRRRTAAATQQT